MACWVATRATPMLKDYWTGGADISTTDWIDANLLELHELLRSFEPEQA